MAAATPGLRAQANPATPQSAKPAPGGAAKPAQQGAKPATPATPKPAAPAAKPAPAATKPAPPAAKAASKPAGQTAAKASAPAAKASPKKKPAAKKAVERPSTPGTAPAAAESEIKQARRDPFESLVGRQNKAPTNLPPGKLGLQVSTLRLDGIVRSPNGMIAVVSNPQARTYFLREGDRLYDGSVEKISMDGVSFHEEGKDAFGKPVEHQVNKRIYSSPGESQ
jgi:type IV pilus assembly protein PilP